MRQGIYVHNFSSGKSTQLGQFILENAIDSGAGSSCKIVCTQPRRISATSLADRVAAERSEKMGKTIGYTIRGESVQSPETRLLFCTTGVLLRMIQGDPLLEEVSHVIIDEVHERGVDSDFLLILLRDLVSIRKDLKLILMSATIDAKLFSSYFNLCEVVEIEGRTFPVENLYLEDFLDDVEYQPSQKKQNGRRIEDEDEDILDDVISKETSKKLSMIENSQKYEIDYGLISAVVKYICEQGNEGAILVFISGTHYFYQGVMEIKKCIDSMRQVLPSDILGALEIFPLHSQLTSKEQQIVFKRVKHGQRKIVVSTNISETSVTIDDVVYCIDTGRVKEMQLVNNVLSLQETWASKAACKQRRGRAGRVQPGICYKLFSRKFESKHMVANTIPEMLRLPLEQLCLQIKSMGINDVHSFLAKVVNLIDR